MNRIVHFEIHAKDMDRMQQFYQDVFGWEFQNMGAAMGNYRVIMTGPSSFDNNAPGINGGMTLRKGDLPKPGDAVNAYVCIVGVDNIDTYIDKAEKAGAQVALAKMDVPHVGKLAYYRDPEENIFGIIEPYPESNPTLQNKNA